MVRPEPPLRPLYSRLFHWGPIIAMSIVACIAITSIYCHLQWWPPEKSLAGLLDMIVFLIWNYFCLSNMLQASYIGPGYVPLGWRPENSEDEKFLQSCDFCDGFKAPRAHHCRQCNRCVMRMDHHCPWINNCCGHRNQGYFVAFLISAVMGCIHATLILGPSLYWAVFRVWYLYYGTGREPRVELGLYGLFAAIFSFGLAVGVIVAVGFLFLVQMRIIIRNRTGIEDYIVAKATSRERDDEFVYPYDLGWKKNFQQVITWNLIPKSNGIVWPVREGCDQYTLTREQIEQKRLKRLCAVEYLGMTGYDGRRCIPRALGGCRAFFTQPWMPGEVRLKVEEGDRFMVMRWRRHWLYGERRIQNDHQGEANNVPSIRLVERGWIPKKCVVEMVDDDEAEQAGEAPVQEGDGHQNHVDAQASANENGVRQRSRR